MQEAFEHKKGKCQDLEGECREGAGGFGVFQLKLDVGALSATHYGGRLESSASQGLPGNKCWVRQGSRRSQHHCGFTRR